MTSLQIQPESDSSSEEEEEVQVAQLSAEDRSRRLKSNFAKVVALDDVSSDVVGELSFKRGDVIFVTDKTTADVWKVNSSRFQTTNDKRLVDTFLARTALICFLSCVRAWLGCFEWQSWQISIAFCEEFRRQFNIADSDVSCHFSAAATAVTTDVVAAYSATKRAVGTSVESRKCIESATAATATAAAATAARLSTLDGGR